MSVLSIIGIFLVFVGYFWLLVAAFTESIIWGVLGFFFPIVLFVFFFVHLDKAWKPVAVQFVGLVLMAVGFYALGDALGQIGQQ